MIMSYMEPVSFTSAQDRPISITSKSPAEIIAYLKKVVLPTVSLLPEECEKENDK